MKRIILGLVLSAALHAAPEALIKTDNGFMFPSKQVKTYYTSRVIWGEGFGDHNKSSPVVGVAVVVWSNSDNWKFITTTNEKGEFKVEVQAGSAFRIKASDGDGWNEYDGILPAIPVGTTKNDP